MSMNFNRLSTDDKILIMEGAQVLGDVVAGEGTAFWYNSVCRGEMQSVRIGKALQHSGPRPDPQQRSPSATMCPSATAPPSTARPSATA